jgi:hypothetical protein
MHQRKSSSSVISAPGAFVAVTLRSSSVTALSTACTATSLSAPWPMRIDSTS